MNELITARLRIQKATAEATKKIAQMNDADRSSSYLNSLSAADREVIFKSCLRDWPQLLATVTLYPTVLGSDLK